MPGHKAWCRFNNSRVSWNHSGYAIERAGSGLFSQKVVLPEPKKPTIREEALQALKKYTQDVVINRMQINWPK